MIAKGRSGGGGPLGERSGASKLTEESVREIRMEIARGESQRALAKRFGVSPPQISYIKNGLTWKHVPL